MIPVMRFFVFSFLVIEPRRRGLFDYLDIVNSRLAASFQKTVMLGQSKVMTARHDFLDDTRIRSH